MAYTYSEDEQRLLLDKLAIREVLDRYWFGIGRHDVESVLGAFTPDARYAGASGREEIRSIVEGISRMRCVNILCGSQRIDVDGDTARADTQAIAFVVLEDPGPERLIMQDVRYVDRLVRTESGWRIVERGGLVDRNIVHDIAFECKVLTESAALERELA